MVKLSPSAENSIFALDIGTRTVIGIVAMIESGVLRIVAQHMLEHGSRAMYDGQIHDIPKVAATVLEVKRVLEKKIGFQLDKAAIAAAGRSLITKNCHAEMELNEQTEIDALIVNSLEMLAIQDANKDMESIFTEHNERYYYIGHSVIKYYINGFPVSNLVGHRGQGIAADLIATFLPESVVLSLYSVLARVGLEPLNMTLEPIAAIEVLIPESMRLLNLALIDVGAGTSDIAITKNGAVTSYGMVSMAGDEVTESIADGLLVDFNWAEKIKRSIDSGGSITYQDVLGTEGAVTPENILELIDPILETMTNKIAGAIVELNGGESPKMVLCVGGGSRVPELNEKLALKLGLPAQNVASRGRVAVQNLVVDEEGLEGPEGVTVVGIATVALKKVGQQLIMVKVDGKEYSLFNTRKMNVASALSLLDFNPRDLIGQNGRDLKFTLNGNPEVVYGDFTSSAEIYINGQKGSLQSAIGDGDEISLYKAGAGADAKAFVGDYLSDSDKVKVFFDGRERTIPPVCLLNGAPASAEAEIKNGDRLSIENPTLEQYLNYENRTGEFVYVNGAVVGPEYILRENDRIDTTPPEQTQYEPQNEPGDKPDFATGTDTGTSPLSPAPNAPENIESATESGDMEASAITVSINGNKVKLTGKDAFIFVDVFNHVDLDLGNVTTIPQLTLNGETARFSDKLSSGDVIEIILK